MNQLIDAIAKQPLGVKAFFLAVLVLIILVGNQFVLIQPYNEELESLQKKSEELQVRVVENKTVADNKAQFQEEVSKLNEELRQAVALLPNEKNLNSILRQFSIRAKQNNIDLLSFKPGGVVGRGFYSEIPMQLQIRGTYNDLAVFLNQIGKLDRIINVSNITFSSISDKGGAVQLTMNTTATTFMFAGKSGGGRSRRGKRKR